MPFGQGLGTLYGLFAQNMTRVRLLAGKFYQEFIKFKYLEYFALTKQ